VPVSFGASTVGLGVLLFAVNIFTRQRAAPAA
jgi:hypothetical protein